MTNNDDIIVVPAEDRTLIVIAESRQLCVSAEWRVIEVPNHGPRQQDSHNRRY